MLAVVRRVRWWRRPRRPPRPRRRPAAVGGGGAGRDPGVQVQEQAFEAGGGSGIVASKRYPGVLWAIRDRGGQDRPGQPQNALYAYKVADGKVGKVAGGAFKAVPMPVPARDWEDIGRDSEGNLWVADIGNNECDRADTALLKVREPDPAASGPAKLLATYRYRFPDPPCGCAGRNAEAMFLVDDVPYLIDKAEQSTLYRFPSLDPEAAVTLEKVGVLAGEVANLSGADLSTDRRPPGRRHPHRALRLPGRRPVPRGCRPGGRPDQPPPGLDRPARRPRRRRGQRRGRGLQLRQPRPQPAGREPRRSAAGPRA